MAFFLNVELAAWWRKEKTDLCKEYVDREKENGRAIN